jgi:hypothetical protein
MKENDVRIKDKSLCQRGLKAAWTRVETWPGMVSAQGDDSHRRGGVQARNLSQERNRPFAMKPSEH